MSNDHYLMLQANIICLLLFLVGTTAMVTQATTQPSVTSQTIAVEQIRIASGRPFAEVRRKFESTVPKLDTGIVEARQRSIGGKQI
jgi:hypothetical protein